MKKVILRIMFLFLMGTSVPAAEVTTVKGSKVLINLSGMDVQVGQQFFVISAEGKKTAIIEIKKIQGGRAIAEVVKGTPKVGASIQAKSGSSDSSAENSEGKSDSSSSSFQRSRKKMSAGVLAAMGSHTFSMDIGSTTPRDAGSLAGTSIGIKGFADYDLGQSLTIRAAAGLETFSTKGTIAHSYCDGGTSANCAVSFNYFALEGSGHYNYLRGKTKAWVGLGYSFLFQMSASNNIPNLQTSSTNNMLLISTGADIGLSKGKFIPVALEYGLFPGSADVKATSIFLRVGYGFPF